MSDTHTSIEPTTEEHGGPNERTLHGVYYKDKRVALGPSTQRKKFKRQASTRHS